jgi:hypothetical protein
LQRVFKRNISNYQWEEFVAQSGSQLGGKGFADDEKVETEVQEWLRQQPKDFYAAGFDALVKRRDRCISIGGGYVEKEMFFSKFEYHMFYVFYPFVTYLLTVPRIIPKSDVVVGENYRMRRFTACTFRQV